MSKNISQDRKISKSHIKKSVGELMEWYAIQDVAYPWRKHGTSDYKKILAELFLLQTNRQSVANILPHFVEKFPSWQAINQVSSEEIQEAIKPLGLWRKRSKL